MQKNMFETLLILLPICFVLNLQAQQNGGADKTEAPYFFIQSDDPGTDRLPLKTSQAEVSITGVIADVTVTQTYQNDGSRPLEAVYIFPASTRAAVYKLMMRIGSRTIEAKIEERDRARREYETAKQEGYSASLLEQQRPNVFQMNIANIMPGDTIEVELRYTERLLPESQEYVFVYPAVVGPRYANDQSAGETWISNPYLGEGKKPTYAFDIGVRVSAGMPIQQMVCTSHRTRIDYLSETTASIKLDPMELDGGDRDFILRYRLAGEAIGEGLLLYRGKSENYFLMMMQPPERIVPESIPPREYIFIVDVSGSMHGFPLEISKSLIRDLVRHLRSRDYFNILLFAGGSSLLAHQSLPANQQNIDRALDLIDHQTGGGGTEILPALQQALSLPRQKMISRTIVIATDGYVSVEKEAFDLIRNNLNKSNVFAFGIGSSVNRFLIEGIARAGQGEPFVITEYAAAADMARRFRKYIETPVLTHITYSFDGFNAYDVEPQVIPDLFAERPVMLCGKWRGSADGKIIVSGQLSGDRGFRYTADVAHTQPHESHVALRYLWARDRIARLSDYYHIDNDREIKQEITGLGLTYNLLTEFTSFLAIDSERKNNAEGMVTVNQPLPLPRGVSGYALAPVTASGGGMFRSASHKMPDALEEAETLQIKPSELHLAIGHFVSNSGADTIAVKYFIQSQIDDLQKCLLRSFSGSAAGKILLLLIIDPQGYCRQAKIIHHSFPGLGSDTCLTGFFEQKTIIGNWPGETSRVTCELILQ